MMKQADIAKQRLHSQQLSGTQLKTAPEMVAWFGAVQAQEYQQAKWALGLRLPHLQEHDIEKDFTAGRILRTHLLRPTWHFVAAADIRWLLELTGPRVHGVSAYMYRQGGLDAKTFSRCHDIIGKALQGGKQLTRDALNDELKKHKIEASGHKLSYIMMHAELEGLICSGARQGKQFTYALMDERVPATKSKTREEALATLSRRYVNSRGPATAADFATWSGLTQADCKKGLESIRKEVETVVADNVTYYLPAKPAPVIQTAGRLLLLPIYDELVMGYRNRDAILQFYQHSKPRPVLTFDNTLVYDGQIIGTWKRAIRPKVIELDYVPFAPLSKTQQSELKKALQRYRTFMNLELLHT